MSSAISKRTKSFTTTLSAFELTKIELKHKILLLDDVFNKLEDQALVLEGVSNSLQAIIDRKNLKRLSDECECLIETVKKFSNDAFNHENEVFTCLQKEAENITCDSKGKKELKGQVEIFKTATKTARARAEEKQSEITEAEGQLNALESTTTENTLMGTWISTGLFTTVTQSETPPLSMKQSDKPISHVPQSPVSVISESIVKTRIRRDEFAARLCPACSLTTMDLSWCINAIPDKNALPNHPECCFHPAVIAKNPGGMKCRCCKLGVAEHCRTKKPCCYIQTNGCW
jgi:hypothetical protein